MGYRQLLIAMLGVINASHANATSWENAIAATEIRSAELWKLAEERGLISRHLGTFYNEHHINEHRCSILGRMLGKTELIEEIEQSTEIDIDRADAHSTALAAQSLDNWIYSARSLIETNKDKRVREWNLDCVGHLGIPSSAYIGETNSATFYEIDGDILRVMGDVEVDFAKKLQSAVRENPQITTVALGSGGGSVGEALEAGYFIRSMGLTTTLWNNCYSACTIVFIGGTYRQVWSPYPELLFHQASRSGAAIPFDDEAYLQIARYVASMGVDVDTFMGLMLSAPPSSFTKLPAVDLCGPRIATWVQRLC